ncbi:unnamed protein product, partial [Meganyctiphanes norvegica]
MSKTMPKDPQSPETNIDGRHYLSIIFSAFAKNGKSNINRSEQSMITSMQDIDKLRSAVQDVHVPLEVFEYIDGGRNPQLYTKDCMEKALAKNEQVNGCIDSYKRFKAMLLVELSHVFPNEMTRYRAVREVVVINY